MTLRDWLELLIVPLSLVLIGFYFTTAQDELQRQIEETQRAQQARIEEDRAAAEQQLAEQRAQDEALQAYLDQMSGLLLERDLRTSEEDSEVRTLARARTLTVLQRLDPSRKTALMQFLVEAELVQGVEGGRGPIIGLSGANLSSADLSSADLRGAYLSSADLSGAELTIADLQHAKLIDADLSDARLMGADLSDANLSGANLSGADLGAGLFLADLSQAKLSFADLSEASGWTEELEQQASSLKGATMPNGQQHEEWVKDREKRQQDE